MGWDGDLERLIQAFRAIGPAAEPFELSPERLVLDPGLFHRTLAKEIDEGPEGPSARSGVLKRSLETYLAARREGR